MKIRHCVRVVLLNHHNEVLFLYADDPSCTTADGVYNGPFWFLVGGAIEGNETIYEAALREIYEETSITKEKIDLGPLIWHGNLILNVNGELTRLQQQFVVARTREVNVSLNNATEFEKSLIKNFAWFSLDQIIQSPDIIYPLGLPTILPPILAGHYPNEPFAIDL